MITKTTEIVEPVEEVGAYLWRVSCAATLALLVVIAYFYWRKNQPDKKRKTAKNRGRVKAIRRFNKARARHEEAIGEYIEIASRMKEEKRELKPEEIRRLRVKLAGSLKTADTGREHLLKSLKKSAAYFDRLADKINKLLQQRSEHEVGLSTDAINELCEKDEHIHTQFVSAACEFLEKSETWGTEEGIAEQITMESRQRLLQT